MALVTAHTTPHEVEAQAAAAYLRGLGIDAQVRDGRIGAYPVVGGAGPGFEVLVAQDSEPMARAELSTYFESTLDSDEFERQALEAKPPPPARRPRATSDAFLWKAMFALAVAANVAQALVNHAKFHGDWVDVDAEGNVLMEGHTRLGDDRPESWTNFDSRGGRMEFVDADADAWPERWTYRRTLQRGELTVTSEDLDEDGAPNRVVTRLDGAPISTLLDTNGDFEFDLADIPGANARKLADDDGDTVYDTLTCRTPGGTEHRFALDRCPPTPR